MERNQIINTTDIRIIGEDEGIIRGYISSEAVDSYNTVFPAEVMRDAMERFTGKVKVLHHNYSIPVGKISSWGQEDGKTWIEAQISRSTEGGREAWVAIKEGLLDSFSIGFRWISYAKDDKTNVRTFEKIDVTEISLVDNPANPDAKITDIRERNFMQRVFDFFKGDDGSILTEETEGDEMDNKDIEVRNQELQKELEEKEQKIKEMEAKLDEYDEKAFIEEMRSRGFSESVIEEDLLGLRKEIRSNPAILKLVQNNDNDIPDSPSTEDSVRSPEKTDEQIVQEMKTQYIQSKKEK